MDIYSSENFQRPLDIIGNALVCWNENELVRENRTEGEKIEERERRRVGGVRRSDQ